MSTDIGSVISGREIQNSHHVLVSSITQQSTKRDNGCQTGEVQIEERRHTLDVQGVSYVTGVERRLSLDVFYQPSKQAEWR